MSDALMSREISNRQRLVADKMQADHTGHRPWLTIAEMAPHGIPHHFPELFDRFSLRDDGMAKRGGDKSTVNLVFTHLEEDFGHAQNIAQDRKVEQGAVWSSDLAVTPPAAATTALPGPRR